MSSNAAMMVVLAAVLFQLGGQLFALYLQRSFRRRLEELESRAYFNNERMETITRGTAERCLTRTSWCEGQLKEMSARIARMEKGSP